MRCSTCILFLIVLIEQCSSSQGSPFLKLKDPTAKYRSPAPDCVVGLLPESDESRMQAFWSRLGPLSTLKTLASKLKRGPKQWGKEEDAEFTVGITFKLFSYSTEDPSPILCSISLDNFHGINIVSENICLQSIVLEKGFAVVVHGWMDTYEETKYYIDRIPWMLRMAEELRKLRNVLTVDWSELALFDYSRASTQNSKFVAEAIYFAIRKLFEKLRQHRDGLGHENAYVNFMNNFIFFGHSMGAHIAGYVGKLYHQKTFLRVSLIIGMDPAGPLFSPLNQHSIRHCLTFEDAHTVKIIHTASRTILQSTLSKIKKLERFRYSIGNQYILGDEDYFFNGGLYLRSGRLKGLFFSHRRSINIALQMIKLEFVEQVQDQTQILGEPGTHPASASTHHASVSSDYAVETGSGLIEAWDETNMDQGMPGKLQPLIGYRATESGHQGAENQILLNLKSEIKGRKLQEPKGPIYVFVEDHKPVNRPSGKQIPHYRETENNNGWRKIEFVEVIE